jgi:hypothetical protein
LVIKLDNALSPGFWKEIITEMNILHFTKGKGGRQSSFIRISSNDADYSCPFLIGRHLYQAVHASGIERKIIAFMNATMQEQTNLLLSQSNGASVSPFKVNTLQILVDSGKHAGYGLHNDASPLLNSYADNPVLVPYSNFDDPIRLPYVEEQQTFTIVMASGTADQTHNIEWQLDSKSGNGPVCGKITTGTNTIHIQTHGSQSGLKHLVTSIPTATSPRWRLVISGRFSGFPAEIDQAKKRLATKGVYVTSVVTDYQYMGVLNSLETVSQPQKWKPIQATDEEESDDTNTPLPQKVKRRVMAARAAKRKKAADPESDDDESIESKQRKHSKRKRNSLTEP